MTATPVSTSTIFNNDDSNFFISRSSFVLGRHFTEARGFHIIINKRCERIHDENSERHALGIGTPVTDDDGEHTNGDTIDELALGGHGRRHVVGSHEDGTEHETTREDDANGVGIAWISQMHDACKDEYRADDGDGNVPGDDLLPQHVCQAQQECQATDFTQGTGSSGMVTDEEVERRRQLLEQAGIAILDGGLHDVERSGTGLGIKIAGELTSHGPRRHLRGESHQQGSTTDKCRIEEVITQSAKGHLTHTDGEQRTDDDDPDGEVAGQVETEQQTGEDGRTVADGGALVLKHELIDGPLEEYAGRNARRTDNGRANAEEIERHEQRRQQGDDDAIHVALDGIGSVCVRRK